MKINKKYKQGFTLVELLMGALVMAVLILAVAHVFYYAWMGWSRNVQSVNMQRDAYLAMEQIAREIRNSNIDEVSADGSGIYFTPDGSLANPRTSTVNILTSDIAQFPNINIESFTVRKNGNQVGVSFTLFTDGRTDENDYAMTILTRN